MNLVVTGGAGAIEPAVTWVSRSEGLSLRAIEFALRDEEDLAHNAQRLIQVVDSLEDQLDDVACLRGATGARAEARRTAGSPRSTSSPPGRST